MAAIDLQEIRKDIQLLMAGVVNYYPDLNIYNFQPDPNYVDLWKTAGEDGKDYFTQELLQNTRSDTLEGAVVYLNNWIKYIDAFPQEQADLKPTTLPPDQMAELIKAQEEIEKLKLEIQDTNRLQIVKKSILDQAIEKQRQLDAQRKAELAQPSTTTTQGPSQIQIPEDARIYIKNNDPNQKIQMPKKEADELAELILLAQTNPGQFLLEMSEKFQALLKDQENINNIKAIVNFKTIEALNTWFLASLENTRKVFELLSDQVGGGGGAQGISLALQKGQVNLTWSQATAKVVQSLRHPSLTNSISSMFDKERAAEVVEQFANYSLSAQNEIWLNQKVAEYMNLHGLAKFHEASYISDTELSQATPPVEFSPQPFEGAPNISVGVRDLLQISERVTRYSPSTAMFDGLVKQFPQLKGVAGFFGRSGSLISTGTTAAVEGSAVAGVAATGAVEGTAAATAVVGGAQAVPVAGQILALAVAAGTALWKGIKKFSPELATWLTKQLAELKKKGWLIPLGSGTLIALPGLIIGSTALVALGVGAALVAGFGIASTGMAVGASFTIGTLFATFFAGVQTILSPIFKAFVISMIGLVLFTALVYFIIQAGAYVIPESENGWAGVPGVPVGYGGSEYSPYISVTKVAQTNSQGPSSYIQFENSDLPVSVQFTVTVVAKKSSLSNLTFEYDCSVISKQGTSGSTSCPALEFIGNNNPIESPPDAVSPLSPYSFTYEVLFTGDIWNDSIITDLWKVGGFTEGVTTQSSGSAAISFGDPPDSCPGLWPILPFANESSLPISQGPLASYTHGGLEAIDIIASVGHTITARVSGTADVRDSGGGGYGKHVIITSLCDPYGDGPIEVQSYYAHLSAITVSPGPIGAGQVIGISGNTGRSDVPHLHYEFRNLSMQTPWIPKPVEYGCFGINDCNVSVP